MGEERDPPTASVGRAYKHAKYGTPGAGLANHLKIFHGPIRAPVAKNPYQNLYLDTFPHVAQGGKVFCFHKGFATFPPPPQKSLFYQGNPMLLQANSTPRPSGFPSNWLAPLTSKHQPTPSLHGTSTCRLHAGSLPALYTARYMQRCRPHAYSEPASLPDRNRPRYTSHAGCV